ncbi:MAG: alkaline phosphatase family protein [Longimicrobiales bacterium]
MGIGEPDPDQNPFFSAKLPFLNEALGTLPSLANPEVEGPLGRAFPVDATLGVEGRPQSGTGQYALLTGHNGAKEIGRHFGPWTPTALRESLADLNLFSQALARGSSMTFANAYPKTFPESRWFKRPAPIPLAAVNAGVMTRHLDALAEGRAVASDILNDRVREYSGLDLPDVTADEAGKVLATVAGENDFSFFAHYATDAVGHEGNMEECKAALEVVDRFLQGVLEGRGPEIGVFVTSDHGNIEAMGGAHTRNPALGLWFPPEGDVGRDMPRSLLDVTGFVESCV